MKRRRRELPVPARQPRRESDPERESLKIMDLLDDALDDLYQVLVEDTTAEPLPAKDRRNE